MLEKLYKEFWYDVFEHDTNLITGMSMKSSMEYLLHKYLTRGANIKFSTVKKVRFDSTFYQREELKKNKQVMLVKSYLGYLIPPIIFILSASNKYDVLNLKKCLISIIVIIAFTLIYLLINKDIKNVLLRISYDTKGYFILTNCIVSNRYVTDIQLHAKYSKWYKYLISLKNVIRLYYISLEYDKNTEKGNEHSHLYNICLERLKKDEDELKKICKKSEQLNLNKRNKKDDSMLYIKNEIDLQKIILFIFDFCNYQFGYGFNINETCRIEKMSKSHLSLIESVVLDILGECNVEYKLVNKNYFDFIKQYNLSVKK